MILYQNENRDFRVINSMQTGELEGRSAADDSTGLERILRNLQRLSFSAMLTGAKDFLFAHPEDTRVDAPGRTSRPPRRFLVELAKRSLLFERSG
jgi:hypothetical protein